MQLEIGEIVTGKVTGITKYGVFVDLGSGKSGMVHISEVAPTYVREIRDFVTDGQEVKVKILAVADDGKISLSIKQADAGNSTGGSASYDRPQPRQNNRARSAPRESYVAAGTAAVPASFDDMLSRFMQSSDEKISSLRKNNVERRPSRRK